MDLAEQLHGEETTPNPTTAIVKSNDHITEDLIDKIILYCEKQSDIRLHPYQREFAERIVESVINNDGDEITALFARQSGKTETVAVIIAGLIVILPKLANMPEFAERLGHLKNGLFVGIFAPSNEQSFTTFSRTRDRLRSGNAQIILNDPEIDTSLDRVSNPMLLSNGSIVRMHSAAKQSQIESKTYHLIVAEEAQDIDRSKIRKSIHPMGASTNATILKIGTSNNRRCEFWETITRNKAEDNRRKGRRRNHYEFDYQTVQKYNPRYKKYIEREKRRLGEDSDEFKMSYLLCWLLERGMFFSTEQLEAVLDKSLKHELASSGHCVVGIDLGKKKDSTVVTVLEITSSGVRDSDGMIKPIKTLLNWLEIYGDDYESQYYEIINFLSAYNVRCIFVDSTGVGTPIADRLHYGFEGIAEVVAYDFSRPSKSTMWKLLSQEVSTRRLRIPAHAKTRALRTFRNFYLQMEQLEKDWQGQNLIAHHPLDSKDAHDDYPDSLGLAVLAAHHDAMPEVEMVDNNFFSN